MQHVSLRDVLGVPPDVRAKLARVLPGTQFDVFALSPAHGVALTGSAEAPYEVYVSWSTARNRAETVRALVASRDSHATYAAQIPPHGHPATTPVCRDLWTFVNDKPHRQVAMDILYPHGFDPTGLPMRAHVLLFDVDDVTATPRSIRLHVPVGMSDLSCETARPGPRD